MQIIRDVWAVAAYEVLEAIRSKRVLIFAFLYVGGAVVGALAFIQVLESVHAAVYEALREAGQSTLAAQRLPDSAALVHSDEFLQVLGWLVDDPELAAELSSLPPLALFYGWVALNFTPLMVTLTAAESVSGELSSGAVRYALLRLPQINYSLGKLFGQGLLLVVSIACGALAVWVTGMLAMEGFEARSSALWLGYLSFRAVVYGFAYVGLVVGISHVSRGVPVARALAFAALLGIGFVSWLADIEAIAERIPFLESFAILLPPAHRLELWRPELSERWPAMVALLAMAFGYGALGFAYRARRDW